MCAITGLTRPVSQRSVDVKSDVFQILGRRLEQQANIHSTPVGTESWLVNTRLNKLTSNRIYTVLCSR